MHGCSCSLSDHSSGGYLIKCLQVQSIRSMMPCTFYNRVSKIPPTPSWKESPLAVDISSLNFSYSPYLTLTSSPPRCKQIKINRFFMKKDLVLGFLHLEVEISFYGCGGINFPVALIHSLGSMTLANWDNCHNKLLPFLAILMEYIFKDTYKICCISIVDFLARFDVLQLQHLFSSAFLAACVIANSKENRERMLKFPEDELKKAIIKSKVDFLRALGDDAVDEFMLMLASIFRKDYYNSSTEDQAQVVMNPFSFSKNMNSAPGSWMIRLYTPALLMDFIRRSKEFCEQTKNRWLHYALTRNNLQAIFQLRYMESISRFYKSADPCP